MGLFRWLLKKKQDPTNLQSEIISFVRLYEEGTGYIETKAVIHIGEIRMMEENPEDTDTTLLFVKGYADPFICAATISEFSEAYSNAYLGYILNQQFIHGS